MDTAVLLHKVKNAGNYQSLYLTQKHLANLEFLVTTLRLTVLAISIPFQKDMNLENSTSNKGFRRYFVFLTKVQLFWLHFSLI